MGSRKAGQGQNEKPMAMMSVHRLGLEFFFLLFLMSSRFYKDGFTKVIATTKICKSTAVGFLSSFRKAVECYFCDFLVGMITFIKKTIK
jgi:hypothetical protein